MFGVGILPSTAGASVTGSVISTVVADITPVLVVLGIIIGLKWVLSLFSHATNGKLKK